MSSEFSSYHHSQLKNRRFPQNCKELLQEGILWIQSKFWFIPDWKYEENVYHSREAEYLPFRLVRGSERHRVWKYQSVSTTRSIYVSYAYRSEDNCSQSKSCQNIFRVLFDDDELQNISEDVAIKNGHITKADDN